MSNNSFIDRQCDSYEAEWHDGKVPSLADWLKDASGAPSRELLLELLKVDLEYRRRSHPELDVDNYVKQFGLHAADLEISTADDVTETATSNTNAMLPVSLSIAPLQKIARFRIRREIGRGGFGRVYLAHDEILNRDVALKVPRAIPDSETRRRFMREAETAAALDHVGIVPIYEAGDWDGESFIASAFCPGLNLSQWLKRRESVPYEMCADIVRCVAEATQHAHNRGVVHRDLKPSNVMLVPVEGKTEHGRLPFVPRVTDFGMAKLVRQRMEDTHSSVMLGTPCYMAPELFGDESDAEFPFAADIYALGVILYESMTGQRPHEGKSIVEVMDAVRGGGNSTA